MDQETLNLSIRKFLKTVGVSSRRERAPEGARQIELDQHQQADG
jgi:hypothetical protein